MTLKVTCPNCGPRYTTEFWFGGELLPHAAPVAPDADALKADFERVWLRTNVAGVRTNASSTTRAADDGSSSNATLAPMNPMTATDGGFRERVLRLRRTHDFFRRGRYDRIGTLRGGVRTFPVHSSTIGVAASIASPAIARTVS